MIKLPENSEYSKSAVLRLIEYILLAVCFSIIALRATFPEGLDAFSSSPVTGSQVYTLIVSTILVSAFVIWVISAAACKRFSYRASAMEIGAAIFIIGSAIAIAFSANKRAAVTEFAVTFAPFVMAILLTQLLDSHAKVKFTMGLIVGLAVVSAWQSFDQLFVSNQVLIDRYEENPASILDPLGIAAGSFEQMLFEHRLYSGGVRGFFTNRNSAGSFAVLGVFTAFALFWDVMKNRKGTPAGTWPIARAAIVLAAVVIGFLITKSKGAILAVFAATAALISWTFFPRWLKTHGKAIFTVVILSAAAVCAIVVSYGISHGRLPGGSSMLVRWQYWQGAARVCADQPFTGIGPGNFAGAYTRYKPDGALETVSDPHNFVLSILTQYGPLGLAGFLIMILAPLVSAVKSAGNESLIESPQPQFRKISVAYLLIVSAALLIVRPILLPVVLDAEVAVVIYIIFAIYILPVIFFVAGFAFITDLSNRSEKADVSFAVKALFCACIAVLIHNLIDFAIFESGVFTAFAAFLACLAAMAFNQKLRLPRISEPSPASRILITAGGLLIMWAWCYFILLPPTRTIAKINRAKEYCAAGYLLPAHELLTSAADDDTLNPAAVSLDARLYLQQAYESAGDEKIAFLLIADRAFLETVSRNKTDYKNFERLTEVYNLLAESSPQAQKNDWLIKAFDAAQKSIDLYPGLDRLHLAYAKIAENLDKPQIALAAYKKAVDIEDAYREQFRVMYPGRELFSRLGEDNYRFAKERIEILSSQTAP